MSLRVEHISCQEVVELVTDYLEGALDYELLARFEHHLTLCDGCVRYVEQIRTVADALGRVGEQDVPPAVRDGLLAAFREFKRA
jgi:hypothetical protein